MGIKSATFRALSLLLTLVRLGAQLPETAPRIEVRIYNYANVPSAILAQAEQETARTYERAGVAVEWRKCRLAAEEPAEKQVCDLPRAPVTFTLRLLSNAMAQRYPLGGDVFGLALLPVNGGYGVVANVFAERVLQMRANPASQGLMLGDLISHELGHLLLGSFAHSVAGIMRGRWQIQELQRSVQPAVLFLPEQTEIIQTQVRKRTISGDDATRGSPGLYPMSCYTGSQDWIGSKTGAVVSRIRY